MREDRGVAGPALSAESSLHRSPRALLLPIVFGSGAAALVYEVVWLQMLQLVIGSTAVSLGVLLGTFMGGMCLGSLLLPRVVARRLHPLRVYALLELGIGACAVARALRHAPHRAHLRRRGRRRVGGLAWRCAGLVSVVCLLPPTVLMGATLPAISRWVGSTREGVSWVGLPLRHQHRGRRLRLPGGRLLPSAPLRHGDGDLRGRRRATRRWRRPACCSRRLAVPPGRGRAAAGAGRRGPGRAPSTWPSRSPG